MVNQEWDVNFSSDIQRVGFFHMNDLKTPPQKWYIFKKFLEHVKFTETYAKNSYSSDFHGLKMFDIQFSRRRNSLTNTF